MNSKISLFSLPKFNPVKNFILFALILVSAQLVGQHRVGVRAGLNYAQFNGPLETNEGFSTGSGFHFGINYTYEFTPDFGLRGEILYTQKGSKQTYDGETYTIIDPIEPASATRFVEIGQVNLDLNISNAYLAIPITAQYRLNRKFELFGGISAEFLVGPSGRGKRVFRSTERPDDIEFTQSYDHRYGSDLAGQFNQFIQNNIAIFVDGDRVILPKIVGGYYHFSQEQRDAGNKINGFNSSAIGGVNYFINPGFYLGLRLEYGLLDITNNAVDFSLNELDENDNYIFRDDNDRLINISVSFGFRF